MFPVSSGSSCVPSAPSRRSFVALSALVGVGVPALAGCDLPGASKDKAGAASPSGSTASDVGSASASAPAKAGSTQWQKLDGHVMGHKVSVEVSPVVRQDETTSYIAVKLTRASDDASIDAVKASSYKDDSDNKLNISNYLGVPSIFRPGTGASLVKLLDLGSGRVWSAINGSGTFLELAPGEDMTSYLSFGKVDTDTVTVMVPMAGFTTVSVLDAGDAKKAKIDLSTAQTDIDKYPRAAPELADPVAIERYTRALDDSTSTHAGSKDITVTLASDVTFDSDSANLTPGADTQLKTVAGQLGQHPDGGTLTIVGHTDDIQDDAYNQTLSEKRANAVKTRLEQLTKLDKWKTTVSGKGESQPKIKGTTDEARAANRRVEITLTPTGGTTPKNTNTPTSSTAPHPSSGKLPDPQGPVAKGPEGVTLNPKSGDTSGEVTITLDHVTRKGGYLLGTVTCTVKDGSTGAQLHPLLQDPQTALSNQRDEDGSAFVTQFASDGLTLLSNGERIFPADYNDAYNKQHLPLTELNLSDHLKTGTTTICVVWPDPGGDTITLDHAKGKYSIPDTAYRLTDIPIKNS